MVCTAIVYEEEGDTDTSRHHSLRQFQRSPDFTSSRFGYYDSYIKDQNGIRDTVQYSYYAGQVFSPPSGGKQGLISFNVSNNLEMKFKDKNDSIRKVSLIDDLSMGISYNTAAPGASLE